ncbi:hypothetical protein B0H34DRAFT_675559 [Crassisporium funariophilum]|nr:hypothetical protein B0H34DRAFT_675559 [Crassisporium funariophilum]
MPPKGKQSFLRQYFYDHPPQQDNSHLMGNPPHQKRKVYCKLCFNDAFLTLKKSDCAAVASGSSNHVRSDEVLKNILFSSSKLVIQAHVQTLANHIINCELQPTETKAQASGYKQTLGSSRSPVKQPASADYFGTAFAGPAL